MEGERNSRGSREIVERDFGEAILREIKECGDELAVVIKDAIAEIARGEGSIQERKMKAEECLKSWRDFLKNLSEKGADENVVPPEIK